MKSTIEELGPTRVRMAIEVPWGDLDHAFGEVYKELGRQDCASVLQETLAEEKATDEKLTRIAEARINRKAVS